MNYATSSEFELNRLKNDLLEELRLQGISDERVLSALGRVPREEFVPARLKTRAYDNVPLPLPNQQSISQPFIVAYMPQALRITPTDRVLEIGTGSGYQAAVLAELTDQIYSIEIVKSLGQSASTRLKRLGYQRVKCQIGDGFEGWKTASPFDKIIITAAPENIPAPLIRQLEEGGSLIAPVGTSHQELVLLKKTGSEVTTQELIPVRFVPLTRY